MQSAVSEGTTLFDVKIAISTMLDSLTVFMMAHDQTVASARADETEEGQEISVMNKCVSGKGPGKPRAVL